MTTAIYFILFLKIIYLFIYLWLHWVFVAALRLSLVVTSSDYSLLQCTGFSLWWLLLLRSTGSRCVGFSSCVTWAQQLWHIGLVAPQHTGSSCTRARNCVTCIGRQILNHSTTREVPRYILEKKVRGGFGGKNKVIRTKKIHVRKSLGSGLFFTKKARVIPCDLVPWSFKNRLLFRTSPWQWIWQWVWYTWNKTGHESIRIEDGWYFWVHYTLLILNVYENFHRQGLNK